MLSEPIFKTILITDLQLFLYHPQTQSHWLTGARSEILSEISQSQTPQLRELHEIWFYQGYAVIPISESKCNNKNRPIKST